MTVSKMADAYQVFINEGKDTPLCAVKEIEKSGETYWTPQQKESEVFSEDTAYNIMNRMLREVVTDGTGISAQVTGLDVCGKTGTSEYGDHWFVGMIPGNVCAVWYKSDKDMDAETADAARICKGVFEKTRGRCMRAIFDSNRCERRSILQKERTFGRRTVSRNRYRIL